MVVAERLRKEVVRGAIEAGSMKVVADDKSAAKHTKGKADYVKRFLGIMIDTTDLLNPTNFLPDDKATELRIAVAALYHTAPTKGSPTPSWRASCIDCTPLLL